MSRSLDIDDDFFQPGGPRCTRFVDCETAAHLSFAVKWRKISRDEETGRYGVDLLNGTRDAIGIQEHGL